MITEILSKIFDVVINKVALPTAILCALLIFLPKSVLSNIDVLTIVNSYRGIIWLIFLFSFLMYTYDKGKILTKVIVNKIERRKRNAAYLNQVISNLEGLSEQEKAWIYFCLKENKRTLIATSTKETAVSLENKGLVLRPRGCYSVLDTPFTFYPIVWSHLCKNKETFCPQERLKDVNYNRDVINFVRDLKSVI